MQGELKDFISFLFSILYFFCLPQQNEIAITKLSHGDKNLYNYFILTQILLTSNSKSYHLITTTGLIRSEGLSFISKRASSILSKPSNL